MRKTEIMTKLKRNQNGITLIALVITIIVLLILAGVAISMLSGENGILRQAANAKTETDKKSTEEQVKLAAMDALMRGNDLTSIENETDLKNALTSQGLTANVEGEAATGYTVTVKEKIYKVASNGKVVEKSIVTDITATNYGDYITGYKDLADITGTDKDWQVFYNDGNNVWIIASDYVQLDETTANKAGIGTVPDGYYAWWNSAPSNGETFDNGNCAKALTTESNWTAYLDSSLATKAMGGPTIEMFAKSYNAKYPSGANGIIDYQLKTTADNEGYQVRWLKDNAGTWGDYINEVTDTASNGMYIKTETPDDTGRAYAYWLASPSASASNYVMDVYCDGRVNNYYFDDYYSGVRPVVCLKSDVQVTSTTTDGVTTWAIQK